MTDYCAIEFSPKHNWATNLRTCLYAQPQRLQTNVFHAIATLKCARQHKPKCMQRFPFSSELGKKIRKCS